MLQQILRDMWVDPELLAELDEAQKQTLFCRMREEQVRRWRAWDETQPAPVARSSDAQANSATPRKRVGWLLGTDGEPWTWVMGEHPDDPSVEDILEGEARERARRQATAEAEALRRSVEAELTHLLDLNQKQIQAIDEQLLQKDEGVGDDDGGGDVGRGSVEEDIYCTVDELRIKSEQLNNADNNQNNQNSNVNNINGGTINNNNNNYKSNGLALDPATAAINKVNEKEVLQEISLNAPKKVSARVAAWERRVAEERSREIFARLQQRRRDAAKEAEVQAAQRERLWREQERKAKEAEQQIREIARRAREEHRRTSVLDMEVEAPSSPKDASASNILPEAAPQISTSTTSETAKPPSKEAVVEWFRSSEVARRAGLDPETNQVASWFHGLISRQEAEARLQPASVGSFLVRISERIWGYAISYRDCDRCKHYLVDASNGHYQFLGANQLSHNTLGDMVNYHSMTPITLIGDERLQFPCSSLEVPSIFEGLLGSSSKL